MKDYPILNQEEAHKVFHARFLKDCGQNDICESDLRIGATLDLPHENGEMVLYLAEEEQINVTLTVKNTGEPAYDANVYLIHPPSLSFVGRKVLQGDQIECVPSERNVVRCELGNPYTKSETQVQIRFSPSRLADDETTLNIYVIGNTTSQDYSTDDNEINLMARIIRVAELDLKASSEPDHVFYGGEIKGESAMVYQDDIGSLVTHNYLVTNRGPSKARKVEIIIDWPFEVENGRHHGKHLLYLVEKPHVQGNGYCELNENFINVLDLKVKTHFPFPFPHPLFFSLFFLLFISWRHKHSMKNCCLIPEPTAFNNISDL